MTVSAQDLLPQDKEALDRIRKRDPGTDKELGLLVEAAINNSADGTLRGAIRDATIDYIDTHSAAVSPEVAIGTALDQGFNQFLAEAVTAEAKIVLAAQSESLRTEIAALVKKTLQKKIEDLKGKLPK